MEILPFHSGLSKSSIVLTAVAGASARLIMVLRFTVIEVISENF
jgi:hypothetical protein